MSLCSLSSGTRSGPLLVRRALRTCWPHGRDSTLAVLLWLLVNDSLLHPFTPSLQFLLLRRQRLPALLADSDLGLALGLVAHPHRTAVRADQHHVRDVDRRFLFGNAALGPLSLLAGNRLLDHPHMLHEHRALVGEDPQYAARLAAVRARQDLDCVVAMNIQTRHLLSQKTVHSDQ